MYKLVEKFRLMKMGDEYWLEVGSRWLPVLPSGIGKPHRTDEPIRRKIDIREDSKTPTNKQRTPCLCESLYVNKALGVVVMKLSESCTLHGEGA